MSKNNPKIIKMTTASIGFNIFVIESIKLVIEGYWCASMKLLITWSKLITKINLFKTKKVIIKKAIIHKTRIRFLFVMLLFYHNFLQVL